MSESIATTAAAAHEEHYDPEANKIGMWLFLTTEVLLFGVLFLTYAVYNSQYPKWFRVGSGHLDVTLGAVNTVILLTSSLTMALAIWALLKHRKGLCLFLLGTTIACAAGFLVVKSFEWGAKFHHGYYPGSAIMVDLPQGEKIFVGLYFLSTGLHAFHVIVGMIVIAYVAWRVASGRTTPERASLIENSGLYWHLVDLIWIYLFPLYYLIS